ncbi:MAG: hypothetical protein IJ257_01600 [Treponema sp.]|nr:hypothetical protein [Treponema sp.]
MKTLEDLYKEVMASEDLKKAFAQAAKDKKVADFLKANGCIISMAVKECNPLPVL